MENPGQSVLTVSSIARLSLVRARVSASDTDCAQSTPMSHRSDRSLASTFFSGLSASLFVAGIGCSRIEAGALILPVALALAGGVCKGVAVALCGKSLTLPRNTMQSLVRPLASVARNASYLMRGMRRRGCATASGVPEEEPVAATLAVAESDGLPVAALVVAVAAGVVSAVVGCETTEWTATEGPPSTSISPTAVPDAVAMMLACGASLASAAEL